MTSSPPPEAPQFRGKTLTPESPLPVHVPEPQNIPVLQKQTDEVFNLMSTHLTKSPGFQVSQSSPTNSHRPYEPDITPPAFEDAVSEPKQVNQESQEGVDQGHQGEAGFHAFLAQMPSPNNLPDALSTHLRPSRSQPLPESLSTQDTASPLSPSQPQSTISKFQETANTSNKAQDAPMSHSPNPVVAGPNGRSDIHHQISEPKINGEGVNYQALLDSLSPFTSAAPAADSITSVTSSGPSGIPNAPSPGSAQTPIATLPIPVGLPPRPPPQEKPAIHPNYTPGEDIRSYHNPPPQNPNPPSTYSQQPDNSQRLPQAYIHNNGVAPNGLPPPPIATFQQPLSKPSQPQRSPQLPPYRQANSNGRNGGRQAHSAYEAEDEYPRRPEIEKLYEEFLHNEAIYVAEGTWDRFPQGSRLFVGNLFTEKVTKRDIFYVFYKHGTIAQISMKSAYGFVQYHDAGACSQALQSEQGLEIRGRKIHLEISKPQKNTRNAVATAAGDGLRAGYSRRSRSPDYSLGAPGRGSGRPMIDRGVIPNNSDHRRVRDDYRPVHSTSPRDFHGRNDFRGRQRTPERYFRGRSRSPYGKGGGYRSRSPVIRDPDDEAQLPIPRRHPRDVPDVQIILVDEVDRTFVGYIQQSFRDRGLRCDVLQLTRVSQTAVIKRQIVEGVQAVVNILRKSQVTGKIPLQVYNRSAGVENIRFDDYEDLDANIAAEIVVRAKQTHMAPAPAPTQYPTNPVYGQPQYPQQPQQMLPQQQYQPQAGGPPSNLSNLITSLDGPALQNLLSAMSQTPQTPSNSQQYPPAPPQHQPNPSQDLASLLNSVARQHPQPQPQQPQQRYQYGPGPQQQQNAYTTPVPNSSYPNQNLAPSGFNSSGSRPSPQGRLPQYQPQVEQQNVQDMLAQLAKYRQ